MSRLLDQIGMALGALARQRVRTALTLLGVTVGTFALVASLAAGQGLDRLILGLFRGNDALRQVGVLVEYQSVSSGSAPQTAPLTDVTDPTRRSRLERARDRDAPRPGSVRPRALLDAAAIERLAQLPHVERVSPMVSLRGQVAWAEGEPVSPRRTAELASADPQGRYLGQLIAGQGVSEASPLGVVIHEYLLYQLGLTGDDAAAQALGRRLRFEQRGPRKPARPSLATLLGQSANGFPPAELAALQRLLGRVSDVNPSMAIPADERAALERLRANLVPEPPPPEPPVTVDEFTIVGVVREPDDAEVKLRNQDVMGQMGLQASLLLAPRAAAAFWLGSSPARAEQGVSSLLLTVESMSHVGAVVAAVEQLGFRTNSPVRIIETVRMNVMLVSLATAFIAIVALTVAALGITNTMIMSVLERTHEIGVMKAVGARDGQVRALFLIEGASIGLVGGLLGLALAWLAAIPGDLVARAIVQAQVRRPVTDSMFAFPAWLVLGGPLVAVLIATAAAYYPANRAARIDPIVALRHD